MGDPSDFALGGPLAKIPLGVYNSLQDTAVAVELMLLRYGPQMPMADLQDRKKVLANARRVLTKYRGRIQGVPRG